MIYDSKRLLPMREPLLAWIGTVEDHLPWHESGDPYRVWISEIMLQQTRTAAVIPYYERFLSVCPDVASLASVDDDRLMKLWEGLGYYSRARNLKKAALRMMEEHGGRLPDTAEALRSLPGIGAYTAGAIASIAFGRGEPAVDGNVLRVVMRYLASGEDVLKESTKRAVADALREIYPEGRDAARLTEALMLLGERICTPNGEARCDVCPLRESCMAYGGQIVSLFPVRAPKKARRVEQRTVLVLRMGDRYAVRRREEAGLLAGMFEYPSVDGHLTESELREAVCALGLSPLSVRPIGEAKHIFSHVEWHMTGYEVAVAEGEARGDLCFATARDIRRTYAIPTAFRFYTRQLTDGIEATVQL